MTVQTADGMDGLRENVVPHRLLQVHLTVVSMESTAQYWRSVWLELEAHMRCIWRNLAGLYFLLIGPTGERFSALTSRGLAMLSDCATDAGS